MSVETKSSVRLTRIINADRERVFGAWTQPEQIKKWSAPEGATVVESLVDLSGGGAYRLRMITDDEKDHTAYGTYSEVEPPSRLVYTWDWEEEDSRMGATRVTVDFVDLGEVTEVTIVHELFPAEEARDGHEKGWTSCLNRLESLFD